ncbi:MAG: hypothetical protein AVDCRST_MAG76-414, partial [uncultured Acidimicrobiales bacterium]
CPKRSSPSSSSAWWRSSTCSSSGWSGRCGPSCTSRRRQPLPRRCPSPPGPSPRHPLRRRPGPRHRPNSRRGARAGCGWFGRPRSREPRSSSATSTRPWGGRPGARFSSTIPPSPRATPGCPPRAGGWWSTTWGRATAPWSTAGGSRVPPSCRSGTGSVWAPTSSSRSCR